MFLITFACKINNQNPYCISYIQNLQKLHTWPSSHIMTVAVYSMMSSSIEYVIIDIGRPPTGLLSPFSVYVALLWSRGKDTIRLLRDFDPNLFQNHPSEALRQDMKRLEWLNEETRTDWQTWRRQKEWVGRDELQGVGLYVWTNSDK